MSRRAAFAVLLLCASCTAPTAVGIPDEQGRPPELIALETPPPGETGVATPVRSARVGRVKFVIRSESLDKLTPAERALVAELPREPTIFTLYYEEGSTRLVPSSRAALDALLADVRARGAAVDVQVSGHTDRKGQDDDNDRLSQARAETVLVQLAEEGVPLDRMTAVGRGERDPRVPTEDGAEEPANRRTVVVVR